MTVLSSEARNVQNPALGALLLWRFVVSYTDAHPTRSAVPLPLLFLVLPIAFHEETLEQLESTNRPSGLRVFIGKFSTSAVSKNDLVLALQDRATVMRDLTLDSLRLAFSTKLLLLDCETATVAATSTTTAKAGVPDSVRSLSRAVEKLGLWCGQLSLHEIAVNLKVNF